MFFAKLKEKCTGLGKTVRASFHTRAFRSGLYSMVASIAVIAIVIAAIALVGQIPAKYTKIDVSDNQMFTLSAQTEEILSGLDQKVTLYHICEQGKEDSGIVHLLEKYTGYSDQLRVVQKDPVASPQFLSQYTTETVENNSVLAVCGENSLYVPYSAIYVNDYSEYYYTGSYTTNFCGESELTGAIYAVTSEKLPTVYVLSGHGETDLDTTMEKALKKQNMRVETLSLIENETVPEDTSCLMINNPASDFSDDECRIIRKYLEKGGRLAVMTSFENVAKLTRVKALLAEYGMESVDPIVLEDDENHFYRKNYLMLPNIESHIITEPLTEGNYYVLFPWAHAIKAAEKMPKGCTVTPLLSTSDSAFAKTSNGEYTAFEDGDTKGQYTLAMAATKTTESGKATEIVWFASARAFTQTYDEAVAGANGDLFVNAFGWMCEAESAISIHAKSLSASYLTVTAQQASTVSIVLIGLIPLLFAAFGFIIWRARRKR